MTFHVQQDVELKPYNTMSLSSVARFFSVINDVVEFLPAVEYVRKHHLPFCVLGGGSNVIFAGNFPGLVMLVNTKGISVVAEDDDFVIVKVAAGEVWDEFLQYCLQRQWFGLENLAIIPGTVGAAPIQNIGAYGQEVSDCIYAIDVIHCADGLQQHLTRDLCCFAYRDSIFKNDLHEKCIITSVMFRLSKVFTPNLSYASLNELLVEKPLLTAEDVRCAVIHIRESKLPSPAVMPNCGSFFKNPVINRKMADELLCRYPQMPVNYQSNGGVKLAAGWLIEQAGWKGRRMGNVGVSEKQALVLVNYGNATYTELETLIGAVKSSVYQQFSVNLEQEPILVKQF